MAKKLSKQQKREREWQRKLLRMSRGEVVSLTGWHPEASKAICDLMAANLTLIQELRGSVSALRMHAELANQTADSAEHMEHAMQAVVESCKEVMNERFMD